MGFKNFRFNIAVRVLLLGGLVFTAAWSAANTPWQVTPVAATALAVLLVIELIRYVESVNRELAGFLNFIAHDDFSASIPVRQKGKVFRDLEAAYALLTEQFRKLSRQRAADHQYLESLVEHVSIALICLDEKGIVTLMNRQAKSLFKAPHLATLKSFQRIDPKLPALLEELGNGARALARVRIADEDLQLALYATEFELLGIRHKLISFQDIRDELEQREIDFAQKLIRVLTHEIMNSVTPIISLTKLIQDRLVDSERGMVSTKELTSEEQRDLERSLASIQSRGSGLLRFVESYKALTNLPRPDPATVEVATLLDRVHALMEPALQGDGIELDVEVAAQELEIRVDSQQIEQVLINLVKNAAEALQGRNAGRVVLRGTRGDQGNPIIQVIDNGPGIETSQLDDIFLPFYTTKRNGTGVGLSVSRQIMLSNNGLLTVKSSRGGGCQFTLRFR